MTVKDFRTYQIDYLHKTSEGWQNIQENLHTTVKGGRTYYRDYLHMTVKGGRTYYRDYLNMT